MKTVAKKSFIPQTVVKTEDGRIGVVCPDLPSYLSVLGPDEVNIVFEGNNFATGTNWEMLEVTGHEDAVADLKKCGAGRGEETCIFLIVGSAGAECQRFGSMRFDLIFRTMKAKRHPTELYPNCQLND